MRPVLPCEAESISDALGLGQLLGVFVGSGDLATRRMGSAQV